MVQDEMTRVEGFKELLDEFKKLPDRVERPPTFMEIAGYPHYENVCSNVLAFFMDPGEPHGLGALVLNALVSVGDSAESDKAIGGSASVEREVSTDAGNRIDILITSDDHAILIENKIHASVGNPLDDYANYLDQTANGRSKHKFLLTLDPIGEGSDWGFANLTYEEFDEKIRSLLGHYVSGADTRYLTIFLDFLNTLKNLNKGTRMDPQFVSLLAERYDDAENFLAEIETLKKELRKKVRDLRNSIDVEGYRNVEQSFYRTTTGLGDSLIYDIRILEDLVTQVEAWISPTGWEIWFWPEPGDYLELKGLLQGLVIPFEEHREDGFSYQDNFAHKYDADLYGIRTSLQDLIDKLAMYQGA